MGTPDKPKTNQEQSKATGFAGRCRKMVGGLIANKGLDGWRKEIELDPDNPENWRNLGYLLMERDELEEAEGAFRKVLELGKATNDNRVMGIAMKYLFDIYTARGDLDKAEGMRKGMQSQIQAIDNATKKNQG